MLLFSAAVLALFWLRSPVESLLGTSPLAAHTAAERRTTRFAAMLLAVVSAICLVALMWPGDRNALFPLGGIAAAAFVAQAALNRFAPRTRMIAQLVGALGLTCVAPAAYYTATGRLDQRALVLWAANWLFACNQIHFVHLRIHAARATTFTEKFSQGKAFFIAQSLTLSVLTALALEQRIPSWAIGAFLPVLGRGFYWFFRGPSPLQIRRLGWSEMFHGVLFGFLLAAAFVLS